MQQWYEENFRLILSLAVVAAIAAAIVGATAHREDTPCEKFGEYRTLDSLPLRCQAYWQREIYGE